MKRFLSSAVITGLLALPVVGIVGCSEEVKSTSKETISTPGGTITEETTKKIKQSGSNPPATSDGVKVDPAK